jgi:oxygen-independent coproporphyrinogen-3 oxidase
MIRERGVASLNADILYGLPHQTNRKISESVQKLLSLGPDRVALYGYAHVPWMARRQTMIPSDHLPTPQERLALFETARELFVADGYDEIGIDHFALPTDGLAKAQKSGLLRRNFQGYTDDLAPVLVGMGAS